MGGFKRGGSGKVWPTKLSGVRKLGGSLSMFCLQKRDVSTHSEKRFARASQRTDRFENVMKNSSGVLCETLFAKYHQNWINSEVTRPEERRHT
jgi:hypothetical protein